MPTTLKPFPISNSWKRDGVEQHFLPTWVVNGSKTGTGVYGWRKKIETGQNAGSSYSLDRLFLVSESPAAPGVSVEYWVWNGSSFTVTDTFAWAFNGFPTAVTNYGAAFYAHTVGVSTAAEAEALNRIYDAIRKEAYGVNGLLVLGELRETIHSLRHPLESARKAVGNYLNVLKSQRKQAGTLKRRKLETDAGYRHRKVTAVKDGMSGTWLELQFGIKPLISDAKEIVGSAIDVLTGEPKRQRIRGKSKVAPVTLSESGEQIEIICLKRRYTWRKSTEASVMFVCGMRHTVSGPGSLMGQMYDKLGFQIQNFVPTIYELIPYSFLLDYFVNLGDIVSAVCTDTTDVAWVSKTVRQDTLVSFSEAFETYHESYTSGTFHPKSLVGKTDSHRIYRHLTVERTIPGSLPIPPLVVSVPGIDSTKWVNMGALLASARDFRFRR
jgi:hypothetical protein